jgi:hypothetical protein
MSMCLEYNKYQLPMTEEELTNGEWSDKIVPVEITCHLNKLLEMNTMTEVKSF